ncbi:MAG TPA: DUF5693 family protein, partial [Bacillota bacterium]
WEVQAQARLAGNPVPALHPARIYVEIADPGLRGWVAAALQARWPHGGARRVTADGVEYLEVVAPLEQPVAAQDVEPPPRYSDNYLGPYPRDLMMFPLGIEPEAVAAAARLTPYVAVELRDWPGSRAAIDAALEAAGPLPPGGLLLFHDGVVPGGAVEAFARAARSRDWRIGVVWGRTTPGLDRLARLVPERLVKVHPMWPGEPVGDIVTGVAERRERVVYFQRFVSFGAGAEATAHPTVIAAVEAALAREGYASAAVPAVLGAHFPPGLFRALAVPAAAAAAALALSGSGQGSAGRAGRRLQGLLLAGGAGAAVVLALLPRVPPEAWQAAALAAALVFPVLAVRCGEIVALSAGRRWPALAAGLLGTLAATAVAAAGGLNILGLLADPAHLAQTSQFRGVTVALVAPTLVMALLAAGGFVGRHVLDTPLRWGLVAGGLVAGAVLLLVVFRSGNFPLIPVPDLEVALRGRLDQVLGVRPRTKEFAFGQPLLVLALSWVAARGEAGSGRWLLPLAVVGQVSVVNSFSHVHTPFAVSLVRTWHGLWIGLLAGALAWTLVRAVMRRVRPAAAGQGTGGLADGFKTGTGVP